MARQLSNFSINGLQAPNAYLNITDIQLQFLAVYGSVHVSIYADKVSRDNGVSPLLGVRFDFSGDLFTQAFGTSISVGSDGTVPSNADDAVRATAYNALLNIHPEAMQLLANSVAA